MDIDEGNVNFKVPRSPGVIVPDVIFFPPAYHSSMEIHFGSRYDGSVKVIEILWALVFP